MENDSLMHYGVLGMHWGVRKDGKPQGYQYGEDGHHKRSNKSDISSDVNMPRSRRREQKDLVRRARSRATTREKAKARTMGAYNGGAIGAIGGTALTLALVAAGAMNPFSLGPVALTAGTALVGSVIGSAAGDRVYLPEIVNENDRRVVNETYSTPVYILNSQD